MVITRRVTKWRGSSQFRERRSFLYVDRKRKSYKEERRSLLLAGYMAATKIIERETDNTREGEQKPNNLTDGTAGTSSNARGMRSSSNLIVPKTEERKNEITRLNTAGKARQEQKLGVSFAPVLPCSTLKAINEVNPTLCRNCVTTHKEEKHFLSKGMIYPYYKQTICTLI